MIEKPNRTSHLLFELYTDIYKAYNLTQDLRSIFEKKLINNRFCQISQMARKSKAIWIQVFQYNIPDNNQSLPNHIELF